MKPVLRFEDDLTAPPPGLMRVPKTVEICITGRCNLSCRYCFYADEMAALTDLPKARWLTFFEEMGSLGVQKVIISGGEAFTRPDIFELIDGLIENKMRYSLLTSSCILISFRLFSAENIETRLKRDTPVSSTKRSSGETALPLSTP